MGSRMHCPSPLGDPCSSCYSSDERSMGINTGHGHGQGHSQSHHSHHHQGPVCSSTPTPPTSYGNYGWGNGTAAKCGQQSSSGSGGRTSPGDLGYHTLVMRNQQNPVDVGLPLGLNLTHGLNTPVPNGSCARYLNCRGFISLSAVQNCIYCLL